MGVATFQMVDTKRQRSKGLMSLYSVMASKQGQAFLSQCACPHMTLAVPPCGEGQQLFATSLVLHLFLLFLFCEFILDDEGNEKTYANTCSDKNPKEDIVLRRQAEENGAKSTETQTYEDTAPSETTHAEKHAN